MSLLNQKIAAKNIHGEYFRLQQLAMQQYGSKSIVLMEVGSFMEAYGIDNETERIGNLDEITDLLNIQLTRKNKLILENSRENPLMAGFPTPSLQKHCDILIERDYTVIIVEQTTRPPNPERRVTQILSPSTYLNSNRFRDSNALMTLYIHIQSTKQSQIYLIGKTVIDLSTGSVQISEASFTDRELDLFAQQLVHWSNQDLPREILWIGPQETHTLLKTSVSCHFRESDPQMEKITYQNSFLQKYYNLSLLLTPIEHFNLERHPHVTNSLISGLQFAYEHQSLLLKSIQMPQWISNTEYVDIYNEGLRQLQVFPEEHKRSSQIGKNGNGRLVALQSVFDILHRTSTPMGSRELRWRLAHPVWKTDILESRWNAIEYWKSAESGFRTTVIQHLRQIRDIQRIWRKIRLGTVQPHEIQAWIESWDVIFELYSLLGKEASIFHFCELQKSKIDMIRIAKLSNTRWLPYFQPDNNGREWQEYALIERDTISQLESICKDLNSRLNHYFANLPKRASKSKSKRPEEEDDDEDLDYVQMKWESEHNALIPTELHLVIKLSKGAVLANLVKDTDIQFKAYTTKSLSKIVSPTIDKLCGEWVASMQRLYRLHDKVYQEWISNWTTYETEIETIMNSIIDLDISTSNAELSLRYNYTQPKIIPTQNEASYIKLTNVRHPLVERFETSDLYVPHSVELGSSTLYKGLILTGLNSSGKTVLMKSIGLSVVLAQTGLYVPCDEMIFNPYKKIFTRISGEDNLLASRSSFAVEMMELKSILEHADSNSLILGDELCRGTEQESALSIVASTLQWWIDRNISFVTATHLYPLFHMKGFTKDEWEQQGLFVGHLWVEINREKRKLEYYRQLRQGLGETLYGLEVAQQLIQIPEWSDIANQYRLRLLGQSSQVISTHASRYNSHLYMTECTQCGSRKDLHTHHKQEQSTFESHQREVMNDLRNLVVLCRECHERLHHPS